MKLNILALGAHPDDVELGAAGTLAKHIALGHKCGIIDFTRGELGTRGTPEIRNAEAAKAAEVLKLSARENLELRDGFISNDQASQLNVIEMIRKYQPDIILCNAPNDRHPDHGEASKLAVRASFLAGLKNIETRIDGELQAPWRPKVVYHYIQYYDITPDFIVDISETMDAKIESIMAYSSQFFDANSKEPKTLVSSKNFIEGIKSRALQTGGQIYANYGEGFIKERHLGVDDLNVLK